MIEMASATDSNSVPDVEDEYELSPLQEGMLFHALLDQEEGMYLQQAVFTMARLDTEDFTRAWQKVIDRHPIFRTSFHWEGRDRPAQVVHRHLKAPIEHLDWRAFPPFEREARLTEFLTEDRKRGLPLAQAPVMRITLIRIGEDSYFYVWTHHHILLDGWSGPLIFKELFRFYEGFRRGQTVDLPAPRPFRDYIRWLRRQNLDQAEVYWRQTLSGFKSATPLPEDRSADGRRILGDRFEQAESQLSKEITANLSQFVRSQQITLNTLIQGAWALLMSRYGETDDVCFGTLVSGRTPELEGVEQMVGLFINTLPVRVRVEEDLPLGDWLKTLNSQQVEARQYEYTPLVKVQTWSEAGRGQPIFESLVIFENYPSGKDPSRAARQPSGGAGGGGVAGPGG